MSRRPDYSLLRDAEKSGRDALNQHIDNQKPVVEQTRLVFNSHARQALRNMDGSFEGQQRLVQDLIDAHAEDRANRLEQNKRAALDQHLEMSNGREGQSLGHRPDYSLLHKEGMQEREAAVEASPGHARDALNQHLEMSPKREDQSVGHRPDYSLLQKDTLQEREMGVEASPDHAREELDQHLEADDRREPQAPDCTDERNTHDPSLEQGHQPEQDMEKHQNPEAQRDAGEAHVARNDPSLEARETQMETDRAESNGSAREALNQHIEQGDRGNQAPDRTEERETGDPSREQDHQREKGLEQDQNLEAQRDAADALEAQAARNAPSLEL
jgi:hypothetical protein